MFKHHCSYPTHPDSFPAPADPRSGFYGMIVDEVTTDDYDHVWRTVIKEIELATALPRNDIAAFLDSHFGSLFAIAFLAEADHRLWEGAVTCTVRAWRRHSIGKAGSVFDVPSSLPYLDGLISSVTNQHIEA